MASNRPLERLLLIDRRISSALSTMVDAAFSSALRLRMSVADWLKGLDLGQYAQAFANNDIDLALAATLTDADLKEIGVASLGHRRKLLAAAAGLTAKPPAPHPPPPPPPPGQDAERRPITVMFCALVGSTSLAARLDPEDWRNLVGSYLDAASAAVTSLGGHVLKKLGDGLMALFGYPHALARSARCAPRSRSSARLSKSTPETPTKAPRSFLRGSALIPGRW